MRVSDAEIEALAAHLELAPHEFRGMYTRTLRGGDVSLREKRDRSCTFYEPGRGCRVYADRPRQCRTWPFWDAVLHSEERWREEAQGCPGMNRGRLRGLEEIRALRAGGDGTSGSGAADEG